MTEEHAILLVEDDENHAALMERAFRKARVANPIHVVGDGDEAVEYLSATGRYADRTARSWPELVLLDLKLPRRSGLDVLRWIRWEAGLTDLPVVVLTSSTADEDIRRAYDLGANSYLRKPANSEALDELVETLDLYWLVMNIRGGGADD